MKLITLVFFISFFGVQAQENIPSDTIPSKKEEPVNQYQGTDPQEQQKDELRMVDVTPAYSRYRYSNDFNGRAKTKYKSSNDIKTLSGTSSHRGGFGALSFRATTFRDEATVLAGARGGWIISRSLAMGFEGHGIIPTAKFDDIATPSGKRVAAIGGYGGFFLEPIFFSNEVVHVTFPVAAGAGWMGFQEDWEDRLLRSNNSGWVGLVDEDIYWYLEPGAALEVNVARNFRINLGVSKRFIQDLRLVNTSEDAFSTWNYFLTLKIGRF